MIGVGLAPDLSLCQQPQFHWLKTKNMESELSPFRLLLYAHFVLVPALRYTHA